MLAIVALLALSILALCTYGIVSPKGYVDIARTLMATLGIWGAAALRLVFALALWFSADQSAAPTAFRVLSAVSAIGAFAVPLMGLARIEALIQWGSEQPSWVLRSICSLGVALAGFLLWASRGALAA